MTNCKSLNLKPGLEIRDGAAVGRDPRKMTAEELSVLGHERTTALKALRARCIDCCAGTPSEVRLCVSTTCPSWPFRMGTYPWRSGAAKSKGGS